jgi:DNA-binding CsgD family transcriptional regulator
MAKHHHNRPAKHLKSVLNRIRDSATVMLGASQELLATLATLQLMKAPRQATGISTRPLAKNNGDVRLDKLTARQKEVVKLLAEGKNTKEAAACLGISPKTIAIHRSQIMQKLDLRSSSELILLAIRTGIIMLEDRPGSTDPSKAEYPLAKKRSTL